MLPVAPMLRQVCGVTSVDLYLYEHLCIKVFDKPIWRSSVRTKWPTYPMASAPFFLAPSQLCDLYTANLS